MVGGGLADGVVEVEVLSEAGGGAGCGGVLPGVHGREGGGHCFEGVCVVGRLKYLGSSEVYAVSVVVVVVCSCR